MIVNVVIVVVVDVIAAAADVIVVNGVIVVVNQWRVSATLTGRRRNSRRCAGRVVEKLFIFRCGVTGGRRY